MKESLSGASAFERHGLQTTVLENALGQFIEDTSVDATRFVVFFLPDR